jgi:hypothetical protein
MFKRVVLAVTFVAALGAAGLGMSGPAMAGHGCGYGGYGGHGYGGHGYRAYYSDHYSDWGYAPRFTYDRDYPGHVHYYRGYPHRHYHKDRSSVYFSIGF